MRPNSGTSTPNANDKLVVSRVDDTHVNVIIDYASASANDVELNNMTVVKSGDTYLLDRSFDNAEANGEITGETMSF